MNKTDLARQYYLTYKDDIDSGVMSKQELARLIIDEHPEIMCKKDGTILTEEEARYYIRRVANATGDNVSKEDKNYFFQDATNPPKVLLFDIETLPMISYHWGLWKQNINHGQIIKDWCLLSWSAKWLNDSETIHGCLTPKEAISRKDKRIVRDLWKLFEETDVIIAHNLKKFDQRKANARFILNGLNPPTPYQLIDTLDIARKTFGFSCNRMDYLGKILVNDQKIKTDFDLWIGCDTGDQKALDQMLEYNDQDVLLLEEVYFELRPWMKSHPNLAVYDPEKELCVVCGSNKLTWKGTYATPAGKFKSYRCNDCNSIGRSRFSDINKEDKKNLLTSVAR